jgi:hypothetical protein
MSYRRRQAWKRQVWKRQAWKRQILALLFAAGFAGAATADDRKNEPPCESVASIGVAHMTADGVITLRVRSLPPGPIGEGVLRYPPDHPQYGEIKDHLGGIAPGEYKPVRPWC